MTAKHKTGNAKFLPEWILKFLNTKTRIWIAIGLSGAIVSFISGTGLYAISLPGRGTGDSLLHLDYAWQVSHGELPEFAEGTQAPIGRSYQIQYVSQHPPLYYMLLAPLVRGPLDNGHFGLAVGLARTFTIGIGILCILSFAWAGWVLGGSYKAVMSVTLPAIATSFVPFVKVSGDIMNDTLVIFATTVSLTLSVLLIKHGFRRRYLTSLLLACMIGMAARATFISALGLVFVAIIIAGLIHTKGNFWQRSFKTVASIMLILALVSASIGWFYWHNQQISGSWYRSGPQNWVAETQGRPYKSLSTVLNSGIWKMLPQRLYGNPWRGFVTVAQVPINILISEVVFIAASSSSLIWLLRKKAIPKKPIITFSIAGILIAQVILVYAQQIVHATGYGSINVRYLLPVWLPLSFILTMGVLGWQRLRGIPAMLLIVLNWIMVLGNTAWFLESRFNNVKTTNAWEYLKVSTTQVNGLPNLIPILIIGIFIGVGFTSLAIWHLTKNPIPKLS